MNAPRPWEPDVERRTRFNFGRVRSWIWQTLYILYSLEAGIFLVFLPWLNIWENNYLLYRYPDFRGVIANSFVRGAVLGLGIVNLLIAIQEITRLRKHPKGYSSR